MHSKNTVSSAPSVCLLFSSSHYPDRGPENRVWHIEAERAALTSRQENHRSHQAVGNSGGTTWSSSCSLSTTEGGLMSKEHLESGTHAECRNSRLHPLAGFLSQARGPKQDPTPIRHMGNPDSVRSPRLSFSPTKVCAFVCDFCDFRLSGSHQQTVELTPPSHTPSEYFFFLSQCF